MVSIDRSSFKLLPEKISQIFIQPPSCFLHKTAQRHIIEWNIYFLIKYPYAKNIVKVDGFQKLGKIADGKGTFLLNGLDGRNIFAEIVLMVKTSWFETSFLHQYHGRHVFGRICITYIGLTLERFCGGWVCCLDSHRKIILHIPHR